MIVENLFHESYGAYYNTVSEIINLLLDDKLDKQTYYRVLERTAFQETPYLLENKLLDNCFGGVLFQEGYGKLPKTEIKNKIKRPLSKIELGWLKTISLDPRIALFDVAFPNLSNVEPLYNPEHLIYCGRYSKGDDYTSTQYIENFKTVFAAVKSHNCLLLHYNSLKRGYKEEKVNPLYIQYSSREDRFRLIALKGNEVYTYNISRIEKCYSLPEKFEIDGEPQELERTYVELLVKNQRDTLERLLLFFSHYEKKTNKIDDDLFKVTLYFAKVDYKEITIQLLSFFPMVDVIGPDYIKERFIEKIKMQKELFNDNII